MIPITVLFLLALASFICIIWSLRPGGPPLWVAALLISILELLEHVPLR
jgi:hypothetical protein